MYNSPTNRPRKPAPTLEALVIRLGATQPALPTRELAQEVPTATINWSLPGRSRGGVQ